MSVHALCGNETYLPDFVILSVCELLFCMLYVGEIMSHLGTNTIVLKGELLLGQVRIENEQVTFYGADSKNTRNIGK